MKQLLALLLAVLLLVSLVACQDPTDPSQPPAQNPEGGDTIDPDLEIKVWTLNGTTGFGMAQLMDQKAKGDAALNYKFTVETNALNVRDALISGDADIAAVPTNVASAVFNATNGGVKILAINTGGVLYLVTTNGTSPTSFADLSGKTVYCPAQNPYFIANALLNKAEISGVTLDCTTYADPTDLRTAVASGNVEYAILPEPMVTIAKNAAAQGGRTVTVALDLTSQWNNHFPAGSLVQGCIVARTKFIEDNPAEVAKFLEEYETSINYVKNNPEQAAQMIVSANIFAQAPVAKQAIPKCNLCFITGSAMKSAMSTFLAAMPLQSIGGALPTDAFYYGV